MKAALKTLMKTTMKTSMKVTMDEVAKKAGVSKTLVSRYLNSKPGVSQENKSRIKNAVDGLHYRLPGIKESAVITIILDGITDFHQPLLEACSAAALEEGCLLTIVDCFDNTSVKVRNADILSRGSVQGVIVYGSSISDKAMIDIFIQNEIPLVLIENDLPGAEVEKILVDNFEGQYNITKHVIDIGFKDIRMIPWDLSTRADTERMAGFLAALRENQLMIGNSYVCPPEKPGFQGVFEMIERFYIHHNLPEIFICSGDSIAAFALISCDKLGINIPGELSITGFDGVEVELFSSWLSRLTTMRQPLAEMGDFAVKRLLKLMRNPGEKPKKTMFQTTLVHGETVNAAGRPWRS